MLEAANPIDFEVFEAGMPNQAYRDIFTAPSIATGLAVGSFIGVI